MKPSAPPSSMKHFELVGDIGSRPHDLRHAELQAVDLRGLRTVTGTAAA